MTLAAAHKLCTQKVLFVFPEWNKQWCLVDVAIMFHVV